MSRVPSTMWGPENPMNICIVGGGAAGYFVADELLNTDIPANITMVEKNLVNGEALYTVACRHCTILQNETL